MLKISFIAELSVAFVIFLGLVTQVLMPAWNRKPLFPILRKRVVQTEAALADANEKIELDEMQRETKRRMRPPSGL